jgi:hypothetical protein
MHPADEGQAPPPPPALYPSDEADYLEDDAEARAARFGPGCRVGGQACAACAHRFRRTAALLRHPSFLLTEARRSWCRPSAACRNAQVNKRLESAYGSVEGLDGLAEYGDIGRATRRASSGSGARAPQPSATPPGTPAERAAANKALFEAVKAGRNAARAELVAARAELAAHCGEALRHQQQVAAMQQELVQAKAAVEALTKLAAANGGARGAGSGAETLESVRAQRDALAAERERERTAAAAAAAAAAEVEAALRAELAAARRDADTARLCAASLEQELKALQRDGPAVVRGAPEGCGTTPQEALPCDAAGAGTPSASPLSPSLAGAPASLVSADAAMRERCASLETRLAAAQVELAAAAAQREAHEAHLRGVLAADAEASASQLSRFAAELARTNAALAAQKAQLDALRGTGSSAGSTGGGAGLLASSTGVLLSSGGPSTPGSASPGMQLGGAGGPHAPPNSRDVTGAMPRLGEGGSAGTSPSAPPVAEGAASPLADAPAGGNAPAEGAAAVAGDSLVAAAQKHLFSLFS